MTISKKDGETLFDSMMKVAHASDDLKRIGVIERELLTKIAALVPTTPPSLNEYAEVSEAPGHEQFEYCFDSSAVHHALLDMQCDEFVAPLLGGRAYLEHVIECRYCQLLCGPHGDLPSELSDKEARINKNILAAAKDAGVGIDFEAKTFKDLFRLPRKN